MGAFRAMVEYAGRMSTTSTKVSNRTGSSGAKIVPWSLAAATSQPPRHGVTPATSE